MNEERWDATGQLNRNIGEKQGEMGRPHGKDGCRQNSKESGRERWKKHQGCKKRESEQLRSKDCVRWDTRRSGEDERWRGGGR